MIKIRRSAGASTMLVEIVIAVCIFAVATIIALTYFLNARYVETKASNTNFAIMEVQSVAELLQRINAPTPASSVEQNTVILQNYIGDFGKIDTHNNGFEGEYYFDTNMLMIESPKPNGFTMYVSFSVKTLLEASYMAEGHICVVRNKAYPYINNSLSTCSHSGRENVLFDIDYKKYCQTS